MQIQEPLQEPLISWLMLAARLCLATVFIVSGIHKLIAYRKAVVEFRAAGVPAVAVFLPLTIGLHLVAAIGLIVGVHSREAALALALFTFVATLKVHCFRQMPDSERLDQSRIALAHLAIIGGLLMLAAAGPGSLVW